MEEEAQKTAGKYSLTKSTCTMDQGRCTPWHTHKYTNKHTHRRPYKHTHKHTHGHTHASHRPQAHPQTHPQAHPRAPQHPRSPTVPRMHEHSYYYSHRRSDTRLKQLQQIEIKGAYTSFFFIRTSKFDLRLKVLNQNLF